MKRWFNAVPWGVPEGLSGRARLVWQGLADNIVPTAMWRYLVGALPHSRSHYLPDEGHLSLIVRHIGAVFADLRA